MRYSDALRLAVGAVLCLVALRLWAGEAEPVVGGLEALGVEIVEVSPAVVMAQHTNGSNLVCAAPPEGLVFVDTGLSTRVAAAFRRAMEERFDRPSMLLVLTHGHLDHILGMGAFADLPVVASAAARPTFERQLGLDFADPQVVAATARIFPTLPTVIEDARLVMPSVWIEAATRIGGGDEPLVVRPVAGHAAGCLAVEWPAEGVVVGGDLVQSRRHPYFGDPETDLEAWIHHLGQWREAGFERICPGHGPVLPGRELEPIRDYFRATLAHAAELKARGLALEAAVADPDFPAGYWPDDEPAPAWWPYCLGRAYLLAEPSPAHRATDADGGPDAAAAGR